MNYRTDLPTLADVRDVAVLEHGGRMGRFAIIALTAFAAALAANKGIEFWLETSMPAPAPPAPLKTEAVAVPRRNVDTAMIFSRDLFGIGPVSPHSGGDGRLGVSLRGTAILGERGYGVFADDKDHRQELFAVGERVFGGPTLLEVDGDHALVSAAGRRHTLEIERVEGTAPPRNAKTRTVGAGRAGIQATDPFNYLVDRRIVEHSIENLSSVITEVRAVPLLRSGRSVGFRLFDIKPGSVIDRMGLEDGDVVQNVNGMPLNDPSKALALLDDMQTIDKLKVDFLRKNKRRSHTYRIR